MKELKAAVIGVGNMGKNHARIYAELEGVDLVGVVDEHERTVRNIATKYDCRPYMSIDPLLRDHHIDVASVVTPTVYHSKHANHLLTKGVSVLIEKPLAHDPTCAANFATFACNPKYTIAVGHIERCNPAVRMTKEIIQNGEIGEIFRISTRRVGPSPVRIRDVGVTLDLATHDLDIMRYLSDQEPIGYKAVVQRRMHEDFDDSIDALIKFDDGLVGVLECDWLSPAKRRTLTVVGSEGMIETHYLTQKIVVSKNGDELGDVREVEWEEPLKVEIEEFIDAVRGCGEPAATAHDGYMAVYMAYQLLEVSRE